MDTKGYEWKLLRYLAEGINPCFGDIDFGIGADMTPKLKAVANHAPEHLDKLLAAIPLRQTRSYQQTRAV